MSLMSQRGYARHRGVTIGSVQQALRSQRISLTRGGMIDSEQADRDWAERTEPGARGPKPGRKAVAKGPAKVKGPSQRRPQGGTGDAYFKSRSEHEKFRAKLIEIEYREKAGELVSREDVRAAAFKAAREARDRLLALPSKLAPRLVGLADPLQIQRLIEKELAGVCDELSGPSMNGRKP